MEKSWRDIVRITEEDETNFDVDQSHHINTYIIIMQQIITPFHTVRPCQTFK